MIGKAKIILNDFLKDKKARITTGYILSIEATKYNIFEIILLLLAIKKTKKIINKSEFPLSINKREDPLNKNRIGINELVFLVI